ncbi:MAG: DEAD/DEAH box helicase family protein [Arachnia sp.]
METAPASFPDGLRHHQSEALQAVQAAWDRGRGRTWVVLPPGAGKTRVGLVAAQALFTSGAVGRAVVLSPNTAIQQQWIERAGAADIDAGAGREFTHLITSLTYQSLAVFDPDGETDDDAPDTEPPLLDRLHPNGEALLAAMRGLGPILLILDECHHLLDVWGRLLVEVLQTLPEARVLSLTATPPGALRGDEAELVAELFGEVTYQASIPAAVRRAELAPFAELVWLCSPVPAEQDYLDSQALRFHELVTRVMDPGFGSTGFLSWVDARFATVEVGWGEISRREPELADAALRLHHEGLLDLPEGARPAERHRRGPSADDWVRLLDDWLRHLDPVGNPDDEAVIAAVRQALPSVGFQWTRRGIRRGRTPVDRVLARSAAKTAAAVAILAAEGQNLGARLRMVVLCDHERATAMVPAQLTGVLDSQTGSARSVLAAMLQDPLTGTLAPLLVTGRSLAAAPGVLAGLRDHVGLGDPDLAARLQLHEAEDGLTELRGWTSRQWIGPVSDFFAAGHSQVVIGTRGLLGEGWDARRVTGVVDLTAATTSTAVVQTRGRALRIDPDWPEKVALNWSVACVSAHHPRGDNDWARLVRKHDGYFGVDESGLIVDGVGHLDPSFSPWAAPPVGEFDAINARMLTRAQHRGDILDRWQVGSTYADTTTRALWVQLPGAHPGGTPAVTPGSTDGTPDWELARQVVLSPEALLDRGEGLPAPGRVERWFGRSAVGEALTGMALAGWAASAGVWSVTPVWLSVLSVLVLAAASCGGWVASHHRRRRGYGHRLAVEAARDPTIGQVARAVADGLHAAGLVSAGAERVSVEIAMDGRYRCLLRGLPESQAEVFVTALDEVLGPIESPRYLVPRWVPPPGADAQWALRSLHGKVDDQGEVWHAVPTVLGSNQRRARGYARAWQQWVGGGDATYAGSPAGAGVLAATRGTDPFAVTSVMRRQWG